MEILANLKDILGHIEVALGIILFLSIMVVVKHRHIRRLRKALLSTLDGSTDENTKPHDTTDDSPDRISSSVRYCPRANLNNAVNTDGKEGDR